jgi:hypothetical protein
MISFDKPLRGTDEVLMVIRPEDLACGSQQEIRLTGEAILVKPIGSANRISVKAGQTEWRMCFSSRPMEGEEMAKTACALMRLLETRCDPLKKASSVDA